MSFVPTASTRKQRRKQEREAKKQNKRAKNTTNKQPNSKNDSAKIDNDSSETTPKRKEAPTKPDRSPGKKARRSPSTNIRHDPYAHLDPAIASAMRKDDDEIADLEKKLGLSAAGKNAKDKSRLNKEYAKKECFGENFGAFLDGLDTMVKRIMEPNAATAQSTQQKSDESSSDDSSVSSSDGENTSDSDMVETECTE